MKVFGFLLMFLFSSVYAEEIRVLSGGAAKSFIDPLAATFPGHSVKIEYQPMGRLTKSLAEGNPADMIVVTAEVLETLKLKGTPIARVGHGDHFVVRAERLRHEGEEIGVVVDGKDDRFCAHSGEV